MTPIPSVNANNFNAPVPNTHIDAMTIKVVNEVPSDLLIVCRRLVSKRSATESFPDWYFSVCVLKLSLTLSKMMIVSFILYHMTVRIAMTKTASIFTAGFIAIQSPYIPAGNRISKSIVRTVMIPNQSGETICLSHANEKRI